MDETESLVHPYGTDLSISWRRFYKKNTVRSAVIALLLVLGLALGFGGRLPKGIAFLTKDDFVEGFGSCYQVGMYYADPVRLPHLLKSLQPDAQSCQGECAISSGCSHFTYWPDGGCLLTGPTSTLKAAPEAYVRSITGPRECPEVEPVQKTEPPASAKVVDFSVDGASTQLPVPQKAAPTPAPPPWSFEARVLGRNGSLCHEYTACSEDRLDGACCPNQEGVMLSCCAGRPLKAETKRTDPGSACSAFKACVAMNLTGACCPSPAGIRLSCCDL